MWTFERVGGDVLWVVGYLKSDEGPSNEKKNCQKPHLLPTESEKRGLVIYFAEAVKRYSEGKSWKRVYWGREGTLLRLQSPVSAPPTPTLQHSDPTHQGSIGFDDAAASMVR